MSSQSILFVFTSAKETLTGHPTGWYLPEAAHPYYILKGHYKIDFAAAKGPNPPVDESSVKSFTDEDSSKFLKDPEVKDKLEHALDLSSVEVDNYVAVFYVGGHGPVLDLAQDPINHGLASKFYRKGKIVSAVCHGPAALVGATGEDGKSIFYGKAFTGLSNTEEGADGLKNLPFLLEDKITELGGKYEKASEPWKAHVVVSGQLITGQNPASSKAIGEAILKALSP